MSSHSFTNSTTVITTTNGSVTGVWEAVTAGFTVSEISSSKDFSIARSIGGLFVPSVSDDSREAGEEDFEINVLEGKRAQLLSLESLLSLVDVLMLAVTVGWEIEDCFQTALHLFAKSLDNGFKGGARELNEGSNCTSSRARDNA
uniref:Uncharacterized protein n=1 Tax=Glossina austeni TaxID=7395 RepID=A0A1A9VG24_GLOAU